MSTQRRRKAARSAPPVSDVPLLSLADARRIAIAAQGLTARPAPCIDEGAARSETTRRAVRQMFDRISILQLDSVNVLARSHYLVAWTRLGAYDPRVLDALSHDAPRMLFEYWAHEASLVPVELYPHLRWRMARAKDEAWGHIRAMATKRAFVRKVLAAIDAQGPVRVGDLDVPQKARSERGWWAWSEVKSAVEWLFWSGQVTAARRVQFERHYDLPVRVIPDEHHAAAHSPVDDSIDVLMERSARALGVGTEADLRDYFRLPLDLARASIARLVENGTLAQVRVEHWKKPAYRYRDAPAPEPGERDALLSPFDSLIWMRERTERLFGMRYRLEVYTPAPQRVHGYYVLPFLMGEELVARVDLKADRAERALRVQAAHLEPDRDGKTVAPALAAELDRLRAWLGLDEIVVVRRGNLATALRRAT